MHMRVHGIMHVHALYNLDLIFTPFSLKFFLKHKFLRKQIISSFGSSF